MSKRSDSPQLVAYGRWVTSTGYPAGSRTPRQDLAWEPPTDVVVQGQVVVIRMELAGVAPEQIELVAEGRSLRISGARPRPCWDEAPCEFRQAEISYGQFARVFEFPESLDQAELKAHCAEGFLTVEVRPAAHGPRRIEIERAG